MAEADALLRQLRVVDAVRVDAVRVDACAGPRDAHSRNAPSVLVPVRANA